MKLMLVFMCVLVGALAFPSLQDLGKEWKKFKGLHKKMYKSLSEDLFRMKIYIKNKLSILAHNIKYKLGKVRFLQGMNSYGDMLNTEFKKFSTGLNTKLRKLKRRTRALGGHADSGKPLPAAVDWRTKNVVSTPKKQGECACCWAFSATGAIEGQLAIKTGQLFSLSEQILVNCVEDNFGCDGGMVDTAFEYVQENGIGMGNEYPYKEESQSCRFDAGGSVSPTFRITGYELVPSKNETSLMDALANIGPISVAMDATSDALTFFKSGIYNPSPNECTLDNINHAVLLVGYGTENNMDYWIVKNSWGSDWAENGFFKVQRTGNNLCGIATMPSYPIL